MSTCDAYPSSFLPHLLCCKHEGTPVGGLQVLHDLQACKASWAMQSSPEGVVSVALRLLSLLIASPATTDVMPAAALIHGLIFAACGGLFLSNSLAVGLFVHTKALSMLHRFAVQLDLLLAGITECWQLLLLRAHSCTASALAAARKQSCCCWAADCVYLRRQ